MSTHIGFDFIPPDVPGKVTGEIKYAEDYKKEGMVFARLLTSPMPSGRVVSIDASEALRMDGVVGIHRQILRWHPSTSPTLVSRS
jgi:xanthine dehydrogenase molybdenum-binding subunit